MRSDVGVEVFSVVMVGGARSLLRPDTRARPFCLENLSLTQGDDVQIYEHRWSRESRFHDL